MAPSDYPKWSDYEDWDLFCKDLKSAVEADDLIFADQFEVEIVDHCNLRCSLCNHSSPLRPKSFLSPTELEHDLRALSSVLYTFGLNLLGGEPLLHPNFLEMLAIAREVNVAQEIWVSTNGLLLHRVPEDFWSSIDKLIVSQYPGVPLTVTKDEIMALCEQAGVVCKWQSTPKFWDMVSNDKISDQKVVQGIYQKCPYVNAFGAKAYRKGYFYNCAVASCMSARMELKGISLANWETDCVRIHDNPNAKKELRELFDRKEALQACAYCLGSKGKLFPVVQLDSEGLRTWIEKDHTDWRSRLSTHSQNRLDKEDEKNS